MMNVLIVDDDEPMCFLLKDSLQKRGHEVTACTSAEEAMIAMDLHFYPLILLDMGLPGMNGKDFCTRIRKGTDGENHYILFVTGNSNP
ncbi:MAG: response regulator, partial [Verrucomicrobiota bacterium]